MVQFRKILEDVYWVGGNDRRLALFENLFPLPRGISYNAYFVEDERIMLLDTVDRSVGGVFFENLTQLLRGRPLDYVVVNHMEPDHCATLADLVLRWPEVKLVCNAKAKQMIRQFFDFDTDARTLVVKEGDTLSTGKHSYTFFMAPMVHWPETMVTYDTSSKILYSADAFGTFGALSGSIFADGVRFETEWLPEARRYYANIVGKYGAQVRALLKKAEGLDIRMLCPLHGPVWRENIGWFLEKYRKWSAYEPEENAVLIVCGSIYGDTMNASEILAARLSEDGVKNIALYDVSATHPSYLVAEAFRCSHLVFASVTYNAGLFANMETLLLDLKAHNLQNRTAALVENGTWAPTAGALMREMLGSMNNMTVLDGAVSLRSSVKEEQREQLLALADALAATLPASTADESRIDAKALFKLSYGLFVLTAREGEKDNGCITNTVMQITNTPKRITVALNKANYTHDMLIRTGVFNVSVLTEESPFEVFRHFGFQSGRDVNKFEDCSAYMRSENGVFYIPGCSNAYLSARVIETADCGTHTLFTAEVTEAAILIDKPSVTYQYYADHIKPRPKPAELKKKGFICKVCGYIYEGDTLPPDFICPVCKHGAEAFEPLS